LSIAAPSGAVDFAVSHLVKGNAMGDAKRRRLRERASILRVLDGWSNEPSAWEAETLATIRLLPVVTVERESAARLAWARMKERLCHDNCAWYEQNDPSGDSKAMTGWIIDHATGNYVLHAVVRSSRGEYRCITPVPHVSDTHFDFIPDPDIVTTRDDDHYIHMRNGQVLGVGIRPDPSRTIAKVASARAKIEAGMDPFEALHDLSAVDH
jgi:hypothetical protein